MKPNFLNLFMKKLIRDRGRAYHLGEGFLTDLGERLLPSKNLMADVRPEFLDDVIEGGRFQPCSPVLRCFAQAALLWRVIKVR
jgi:hypothetical protein